MILQAHYDALEMLGYDSVWLTSGFLDTEFLERQIAEYREEDDPDPEHYRSAAFDLWINAKERYEDAEIRQISFLLEVDPERDMALSVGCFLLKRNGLTDAQFQDLADTLERMSEGRRNKTVTRERSLRELKKTENMAPEVFQKYMALADSAVQEYLLQHFAERNEEFLETLVEKGAARRVRNMAGQKLDSLKRKKRNA